MRGALPLAALLLLIPACLGRTPEIRWACYYGGQTDLAPFLQTRLLVLSPDSPLDLQRLTRDDRLVLGYVSLGEVDDRHPDFPALQREGLVAEANPNWPHSRLVDVRSPRWRRFILEEELPKLISRGFNGLFLDGLDSAIFLEARDARRFAGAGPALVALLGEIRAFFPGVYLMANRGFELAGAYAPHVDAILAESLLTDYDFARQSYRLRGREEAAGYLPLLAAVRREHGVRIYSLDYWSPRDTRTVALIYREQEKRGFIPYVAATITCASPPGAPAAGGGARRAGGPGF